jgi:hypothetical protein
MPRILNRIPARAFNDPLMTATLVVRGALPRRLFLDVARCYLFLSHFLASRCPESQTGMPFAGC